LRCALLFATLFSAAMARKKAHRKQQQQSTEQVSATDLHDLLDGAHRAIPLCLVAFLKAGGQPNATVQVPKHWIPTFQYLLYQRLKLFAIFLLSTALGAPI
jgi:hypothetical protein